MAVRALKWAKNWNLCLLWLSYLLGLKKMGVVLSGVMGLRCMNVIGHQDGRRDILGQRAKWTASWTERRAGAGDGERVASGNFELRRAMVWAGAMGKSIWAFIGLAFIVLCHIFLYDLFIIYLFIQFFLVESIVPLDDAFFSFISTDINRLMNGNNLIFNLFYELFLSMV